MALIAYSRVEQNWAVTGAECGKLHSQTFFACTLSTKDDSIELPVQTCTKVSELKEMLSVKLGYVDASTFDFVVKQGCTYKKLLDSDQVGRKMTVRGLKDFKAPRHQYPHPYGIIGAGYLGLKMALTLAHLGSEDYVVFDRYDRVGGHAWLEMANKTTKLQTEFPTYHLWYGSEWSVPGKTKCGGPPINHEIWPTRDELLPHFQLCAEEYGLLPHCHLRTNVAKMNICGKVTDDDRYYKLCVEPVTYERKDVQGGGALKHQLGGDDEENHQHEGEIDSTREVFEVNVSCLAMWPGALVFPRPVVYPGEEDFGGCIDYAVEMRFDYSHVPGKVVTIIGHGAFTMENIRTCLEAGCKHIFVLCRKINVTCPRPVSWFINQSHPPISGAQILNMIKYAYKHIVIDGKVVDPWEIHSVHSNAAQTHATIVQKTRFGIGDVYFLAAAYGLMEVVIGTVKRVTHHTLHLNTGRKLHTEAVLKCTGCLGDWRVDKLLKISEMRGVFVNGDPRRVCSGEADGINAAQFTTTTAGPGYYTLCKQAAHFWDVPKDWHRLIDLGVVALLPASRAGEPDEEFPAYFFTAQHAVAASVMLEGACPLLAEKLAPAGEYKKFIQRLCVPTERIIREAKADWEQYEEKFRERGMVPADAPYVPYLYDVPCLEEQFKIHDAYVAQKYG